MELVLYFEKLVGKIDECLSFVIDLMLVMGGLMIVIIDMLKKVGCKDIKVIVLVVVFEGVEKIFEVYLDVEIFMVLLDSYLNEKGYIILGLGDVGDKIFGIV